MKKVYKTMDGCEAAAYASYAFTEVAGIYPITPSSPIAEHVDAWAADGMKNLFNMPVKVLQLPIVMKPPISCPMKQICETANLRVPHLWRIIWISFFHPFTKFFKPFIHPFYIVICYRRP